MDIVKFEEEVMFLFRKHYAGTEKIGEKQWFKIEISSLFKKKKVIVSIIDGLSPIREVDFIGDANNYSELFMEMLYVLRDYLLKHPYKNVLCSSCKGRGDFEVGAGSHSYFEKCDKCGGSGKAKVLPDEKKD